MKLGSEVDFLVMGAGVAGLRAAVELAAHGEVLVVTKESLGESNTHYAQGGIAVATEGDQDEFHGAVGGFLGRGIHYESVAGSGFADVALAVGPDGFGGDHIWLTP